jgi:hypothetical protein
MESNGAMEQLMAMMLVEFFILFAPLIFVFADLWSGVSKAKARGERITSRKFRDTVRKIARYYNVLFVLAVLDALQLSSIWYKDTFETWGLPLFPWLTMLGSTGVGLIEVKSIMEPADEKESRKVSEIMALAKAIAEHKSDPKEIAEAFANYFDNRNNENNAENT